MNRDGKIDILKCIGLFCIILAHVNPPKLIFQIRNFDVILMIMLSSYLFSKKECDLTINYYLGYIWKRIKRLLFPTWIFLTFYFISVFFITHSFSTKTIVGSYTLQGGIGYVWIIRIYLIAALLLPLIQYILPKNRKLSYIIIFIVFLLYEIMCIFEMFNNTIINYLFAYIIPVAFVISVTDWIKNSKSKDIAMFSVINFSIYLILMWFIYQITREIQTTNYMKYPFRTYYLSYAFGISGILIIIFRNQKLTDFLNNKFVAFVSMHSLWIYLWHISFVKIFEYLNFGVNYFLKYLLILCSALLVTYIQNKIVNILEGKKKNNKILIIFKG